MISFEEKIHAPIIIDWWRKHPQLASTLILSRGYKLPADWILDLNTNPTVYMTEDGKGLIEIYDTLVGVKIQEAKVFYFSPDFALLKSLEVAACEMCFRQGISVIEFPKIAVRYDKVKRDLYESAKNTLTEFQQKLMEGNKGDINNGNQDVLRTGSGSLPTPSTAEGVHDSKAGSGGSTSPAIPTSEQQPVHANVSTSVPTTTTSSNADTKPTTDGKAKGSGTASTDGGTAVYSRLRPKKSNPQSKGSSKKKSTKELIKEPATA